MTSTPRGEDRTGPDTTDLSLHRTIAGSLLGSALVAFVASRLVGDVVYEGEDALAFGLVVLAVILALNAVVLFFWVVGQAADRFENVKPADG